MINGKEIKVVFMQLQRVNSLTTGCHIKRWIFRFNSATTQT